MTFPPPRHDRVEQLEVLERNFFATLISFADQSAGSTATWEDEPAIGESALRGWCWTNLIHVRGGLSFSKGEGVKTLIAIMTEPTYKETFTEIWLGNPIIGCCIRFRLRFAREKEILPRILRRNRIKVDRCK